MMLSSILLPIIGNLKVAAPHHRQIRIRLPRLVLGREYRRVLHFVLLRFGLLLNFAKLCRSLPPLCTIGTHVHDFVEWISLVCSEATVLRLTVGELFVLLAAFQLLVDVPILRSPPQVLHLYFLLFLPCIFFFYYLICLFKYTVIVIFSVYICCI